jgi:uncharacterized protein YcfL
MKRIIVQFIGIALLLLVFSACGSSKKGCGLTSDAVKIEQSTSIQTVTTAKV